MSATHYDSIAANLDRVADEVSECEASTVSPFHTRLPEVLQGAATSFLVDEADNCLADLRVASSILRSAAEDARQQAVEIELAAAADEEPTEAAEPITPPDVSAV